MRIGNAAVAGKPPSETANWGVINRLRQGSFELGSVRPWMSLHDDERIAMFAALKKSRQLYLITLDRCGDYFDLLRVEMKIRKHKIVLRIVGFTIAALFALLASAFLGLAIILTFWETHRALAAWAVVLLYSGIAGISLALCVKQLRSDPIATTLRNEFHRDIETIRCSL